MSKFRCGPHRWRSGGRAVCSYRVAAHRRRPPAHGPGGSTSCSRFDISGWRDRGLYPLVQGRRGARGESTASMTRGGGDFVFAQIGAARPARAADFPIEQIPLRAASMALGRSSCLQLPGRRTSAPAASARAGGLYVMLSLRHFRLARSWSLSLGAGAPRRARRIDSEHDPRRRRFRFRTNRRCSTGASRRFSY